MSPSRSTSFSSATFRSCRCWSRPRSAVTVAAAAARAAADVVLAERCRLARPWLDVVSAEWRKQGRLQSWRLRLLARRGRRRTTTARRGSATGWRWRCGSSRRRRRRWRPARRRRWGVGGAGRPGGVGGVGGAVVLVLCVAESVVPAELSALETEIAPAAATTSLTVAAAIRSSTTPSTAVAATTAGTAVWRGLRRRTIGEADFGRDGDRRDVGRRLRRSSTRYRPLKYNSY